MYVTPEDLDRNISNEIKMKQGNSALDQLLFPLLNHLNSPMTVLRHTDAPKRPKIGSKPRPPYFDYYTFEHKEIARGSVFDEEFEIIRDSIGDRKSPKAHDRQGHWQSYESSRYINAQGAVQWINPTKVGHPKDGAQSVDFSFDK